MTPKTEVKRKCPRINNYMKKYLSVLLVSSIMLLCITSTALAQTSGEKDSKKQELEKIKIHHRYHWFYLHSIGVSAGRINTAGAHGRTLVFVCSNHDVGGSDYRVVCPCVVLQSYWVVELNW